MYGLWCVRCASGAMPFQNMFCRLTIDRPKKSWPAPPMCTQQEYAISYDICVQGLYYSVHMVWHSSEVTSKFNHTPFKSTLYLMIFVYRVYTTVYYGLAFLRGYV